MIEDPNFEIEVEDEIHSLESGERAVVTEIEDDTIMTESKDSFEMKNNKMAFQRAVIEVAVGPEGFVWIPHQKKRKQAVIKTPEGRNISCVETFCEFCGKTLERKTK